ncbi:peritrophin-1-like [Phlebotomus argentipes]|uniref:peritrophin-1-like n=1 Tax=Phlebotomus argentipes TaxID=94469 RepID=UPI002892FBF1|nr:peritrophin-1-like [Phlebotomus argentipes]
MLAKSVILLFLGASLAAVSEEVRKPTCNDAISDDYIQHPESCNRYYRCVNGQIHDFACPFGMHWSQGDKRCIFESQSSCRINFPNLPDFPDWPPWEPTEAPPNTPPTAAPHCIPGVMVAWPDNHNCQRFYLCIEGDMWHMWCPPNTRFDYMTRRCDPNGVCVPGAVLGLEGF